MLLIYGLLFMSMVAADMDSLSRLQEMKTTDEKYVNVENQEAEVGRGYSTSRASTSTDTVVEFPFNHVCASQDDNVNKKKAASETALTTASSVTTGAVQLFMRMIVNFTPANTMCLGNLKVTDFENKASTDDRMGNLSCDLLALPSNPNTVLTNIGFSVNFRGGAPGFCSYISKQSNQYTFAMAFNEDLIDLIVQFIPNVGLLLNTFVSFKISIGMSTGGHIGKQVQYWDGQDRTETFNAHAYFKADVSLNPTKLIEKFLKKFIKRKKYIPNGLIALNNLMEAYIRFNDDAIKAVDCLFGGPCKDTKKQLEENLPNLVFGHQVVLASTGSVSIDLGEIIGLLPKIDIELSQSTFYKRSNGIFFTWRVSSVLDVLGDLIKKTIGVAGFPGLNLRTGAVFKCSLKNDQFSFMGGIMGSTFQCTADFNKADPIHCSYKGKFFAVIMDSVDDIADAGKAVYLETKGMAEKTGRIIEKGAKVALDIGQDIVDGVLRGVGEVTTQITDAIEDAYDNSWDVINNLYNENDCHCGSTKSIRVRAAGQEYVIHNNQMKSIDWGRPVQEVQWMCADDGDWDKKRISRSVRYWVVGMETRNKCCLRNRWDWVPCKNTARSLWFPLKKLAAQRAASIEESVGDNSAVEESVAIPYDHPQEQEEESVATPFANSADEESVARRSSSKKSSGKERKRDKAARIGKGIMDTAVETYCVRHTGKPCLNGGCPRSITGAKKCNRYSECMCQKGYCLNKYGRCVRSNSAVEESVAIPYDNSEEQEEESVATPFANSEDEESVARRSSNRRPSTSTHGRKPSRRTTRKPSRPVNIGDIGVTINTGGGLGGGSSTACDNDTGGTCMVWGCKSSRGPTDCDNGRCICKPGYCHDGAGRCVEYGSAVEESVATPFSPSNPEGFNTKLPLIIICCTAASIGLLVAYRTKLTKAEYPPLLEEEL